MVLIRVPDARLSIVSPFSTSTIVTRNSFFIVTRRYIIQVNPIYIFSKFHPFVRVRRYFTKFRFIRNFANFCFFFDTVRCIFSCIKIDNCVEFNGRSNVSTNSRKMIFRTQELNSFEDENDSFIMDVI